MNKLVTTISLVTFFFMGAVADASVVKLSDTITLTCPDNIGGYSQNGEYTTGVGGKYASPKTERNADVTVRLMPDGCVRTEITGYQGPEQCGTTRIELETGQIMTRSSCDSDPAKPSSAPGTSKDGNQTGYTGALVDLSVLEKILASWPASAKANCSAVLGCRSGNPMNVGTFHGKVRNYKFDKDGYPVDGLAAGINLIRQWCQNEGRCSIRTVMLKYAPFDPKHPNNNPVAAAQSIASWIGMNPDERFNHHDATTMAKIALGFVRNENGKYHYGAESIKRGAELAFQMWPAGATPKNLGEMIPYTVTNSTGSLGSVGNSPVDNFNSAFRSFAPITNQTPAAPMSGILPTTSGSGSSTTTGQIDQGQITAAKPVMNLIVQPRIISRGAILIVSWTSVGFSKDTCRVQFQGQDFASGNEGTKLFKTVSSDSGELAFTLKCQDFAGQQYTSSASSTVQ